VDPGSDLPEEYARVRALTEALAEPLSAEDQTVQSMPDVSPTKWHRAHTTWFFEEFLLAGEDRDYRPFHPDFRYLFNSYYEAVGPRHARTERGLLSRPGVAEIAGYRAYVDEAVNELLACPPERGAEVAILGLNHEQQHQELLLMDIKHVLSVNPLRPAYLSPAGTTEGARPGMPTVSGSASEPVEAQWLEHTGGIIEVGAGSEGFAFDNERPRHPVILAPFELAARPVCCGDWLAFVHDGGYRRPELWLSEGWAAVGREGWTAPLYWAEAEPGWDIFTLTGPRPVDPAEPVCHLSYYEADAFARWAGARLPTEEEWEAVAVSYRPECGFLDPGVLHPRPAGTGAIFFGQVWEWTASAYLPYPRFRPGPGAIGEYNGKFMINQQVLRGGSCATPPGHVRATYRNFFPPAARWPFTGLRLARDPA